MANEATTTVLSIKPPFKKSPVIAFLKKYGKHYAGLLPFIALFILFIFWPMVYGLIMSFTDWTTKAGAEINFVGLDNFKAVLDSTTTYGKTFLISLKNIFWFMVFVIPLNVVISTTISLIINQFKDRSFRFFRGVFFMPFVVPTFLSTAVWIWLMSANSGVAALLLEKIGIGAGINWRITPGYFLALMIVIDLWRSIGFNMIIITSGIQGIPSEYYEAATIDGANTFL